MVNPFDYPALAQLMEDVEKMNDCHDEGGKFCSEGGGGSAHEASRQANRAGEAAMRSANLAQGGKAGGTQHQIAHTRLSAAISAHEKAAVQHAANGNKAISEKHQQAARAFREVKSGLDKQVASNVGRRATVSNIRSSMD